MSEPLPLVPDALAEPVPTSLKNALNCCFIVFPDGKSVATFPENTLIGNTNEIRMENAWTI